jgi:hypothetical protein
MSVYAIQAKIELLINTPTDASGRNRKKSKKVIRQSSNANFLTSVNPLVYRYIPNI